MNTHLIPNHKYILLLPATKTNQFLLQRMYTVTAGLILPNKTWLNSEIRRTLIHHCLNSFQIFLKTHPLLEVHAQPLPPSFPHSHLFFYYLVLLVILEHALFSTAECVRVCVRVCACMRACARALKFFQLCFWEMFPVIHLHNLKIVFVLFQKRVWAIPSTVSQTWPESN